MFQEEYKKAYDQIKADDNSVEKIFGSVQNKKKSKNRNRRFRPVYVTAAFIMCLIIGINIPAMAEEIAVSLGFYEAGIIDYTMYRHLQREYPGWDGGFVPENAAVTKNGIIMQVEAITFYKKTAVVIVSFSNEEGYDFINGESEYQWMDMSLKTPRGKIDFDDINIWKYDEEEEKLYVKYTARRSTAAISDGEQVSFIVNDMYIVQESNEVIELKNMETNADTKVVKLPDTNYESDLVQVEGDGYPYRTAVLNMTPLSKIKKDETAVTGIAYIDGVLRIQVSHGRRETPRDAYRSACFRDFNEEDERKDLLNADEQVIWYERVDGELVEFMEYYYVMTEEEARALVLSVEYYEQEGYFDTTWEVDFEVDK